MDYRFDWVFLCIFPHCMLCVYHYFSSRIVFDICMFVYVCVYTCVIPESPPCAPIGWARMIGGGKMVTRWFSRHVSGILMPVWLERGNYKVQSQEMHLNCCLSGRLHQKERERERERGWASSLYDLEKTDRWVNTPLQHSIEERQMSS